MSEQQKVSRKRRNYCDRNRIFQRNRNRTWGKMYGNGVYDLGKEDIAVGVDGRKKEPLTIPAKEALSETMHRALENGIYCTEAMVDTS